MPYQSLADAVLVLHVCIVVFVVGGLVAVLVGNGCGWRWVNDWRFRLAHLASIAIIVAQAWLGRLCPLTTLESWLRMRAGVRTYSESFIQHWVQRVLYYDVPFWVFTVTYTAFGVMVCIAWWYFPPRRRSDDNDVRTTRT